MSDEKTPEEQAAEEEYFKVCREAIDDMHGTTKIRILFKAVQILADHLGNTAKACPIDSTKRCKEYDCGCVNCWTDWVIDEAKTAIEKEKADGQLP